jgi:hypothetical protein
MLRQSDVFFGACLVVNVKRYSKVSEVFVVLPVPVVNEFFWIFSTFLGFDQNWRSEVIGCSYMDDLVAFESAVSNKCVCWKIRGGNMS